MFRVITKSIIILLTTLIIYATYSVYQEYQEYNRVAQILLGNSSNDVEIVANEDVINELRNNIYNSSFFSKPFLINRFLNEKTSYSFRDNKKEKLVVITYIGGLGDRFTIMRMKKAAERLNWKVITLNLTNLSEEERFKFTSTAVNIINPDFMISEGMGKPIKSSVPKYLTLHAIFSKDGVASNSELVWLYENLIKGYTGVLNVSDKEDIYNFLEKKYNTTIPHINFFLSVSEVYSQFDENVEFKKMSIYGGAWDPRRSSEKYKYLYKNINENNVVSFYGPKGAWGMYNNYKGFLPYNDQVFLDELKKNGIALVMHAQWHYDNSTPSARIFEAAAASNIIISDDMSFVKRYFGDSVLYFNPNDSRDEMYNKIMGHYEWIQKNPEKAKELARRSNAVFREKFTLEKQLTNLEKFHDNIVNKK